MELPTDQSIRVADYGEDRLVAALLAQLPSGDRRKDVIVGAGTDDCAVVRPAKGKRWQLLKTDCVIEGVHFEVGTPPEQVGWKAMCRPLSDIAATGGQPRHALVTLALNPSATLDWAQRVYAGIARAATDFDVAVVGGDTASTPGPCFISVCLTGEVSSQRCVTRAGGKVGDALFVTGRLGGSFSSGRHLTFRPRLAEARWLIKHFPIHAMMDLSDGLAADLPRLARASATGYILNRAALPLNDGCDTLQALGDGEDYELLFTIHPRHVARLQTDWNRKFPAIPLNRVGHLIDPGTAVGLETTEGYDHFGTAFALKGERAP